MLIGWVGFHGNRIDIGRDVVILTKQFIYVVSTIHTGVVHRTESFIDMVHIFFC